MAYKTKEELERENQNAALVGAGLSFFSALGAFFLRKKNSPGAQEAKDALTGFSVAIGALAVGTEAMSHKIAEWEHDAQDVVRTGLKPPAKAGKPPAPISE